MVGAMKEDWSRLADHVIAGRVRAGFPDRRSFAEHLREIGHPVTERTLGNLESGKSVSMSTLAAVDIGLGWQTGSSRKTLRGGVPASDTPAPAATPTAADLQELIDAAEDDPLIRDALIAVKRLRDARDQARSAHDRRNEGKTG